ncbi:unnamed protein product [Allacma fusca]|uniref:Uncharacterized protein n=1 Tax=Allacma fusca TaxID=39272 RepID=A0A8J2LPX0_9HEXA|nr:unnamed protein product [Allacma fusca]
MKYLGLNVLPIFAPVLFSWLFQSSESFHINSPALNLLIPREHPQENQYFITGTSKHKTQSRENSKKSFPHWVKKTEEEIPRDQVKRETSLPQRKFKRSPNMGSEIKSEMKSAGKTILHETRSGARAVFHQIGDWLG